MITLAVCAVMAWHGTSGALDAWAPRAIFIYWGVFSLVLLVTLYLALLDLRYTWLEFKLGERSLYQDTLGEESFREAIKKARQQAGDGDNRPGDSSR